MNEISKLEQDIASLVSALDITPSMYKNAEEKYQAIGKCLLDNGYDTNIYPQGSFALGTVVRPYKNAEEQEYDLDVICEILDDKTNSSPQKVRSSIEDTLDSNANYDGKIKEYEKCITIEYAKAGDADFNIDVIPAISEDVTMKNRLISLGNSPEQANTAIAIAVKQEEHRFSWSTTANPKAYKTWFESINVPFSNYNKTIRMQKLFEANQSIYNSVEDIPSYFNKSSLQMAIQFFKRARDVYFSKIDKYDYKPISAIISTIVADVAKSMPENSSIIEIILKVLEELKTYSKYQTIPEAEFAMTYSDKVTIVRTNGEWKMMNPTNPLDNLIDSWNEEPDKAKFFFQWITTLDVISLGKLIQDSTRYYTEMGNILGQKLVEKHFNVSNNAQPINEGAKPWRS